MRPRYLPGVCWRSIAIGLLAISCLPALAAAEESAKADPPRIEAAFLRNFAHYVTWPPDAFANDNAPWRVCILGRDPFGDVLEETFAGRSEQGRHFVLIRAEAVSELTDCQIVFVAVGSSERRRAALAELAKQPVLTVGDAPGFLQEGGIIRFQVSDHVAFGVNLDRARTASLKIQTKMLEVAQDVLDNGVVQRRR